MNPRLQQTLGLAAWGALAALQIVWHAWLRPSHSSIAISLVIALVPLAIPLLYWRRPARALLLAAMICLFYFCHGVAAVWTESGARTLAIIEIVLAIAVIIAPTHMPKRRAR